MNSARILSPEEQLLLLCRHAKSSWQDHVLSDVERPLNARGQRDAPEMGRRLLRRGLHPDLILSSHAVRARSTAVCYAEQLGYPPARIRIEPAIYSAETSGLLTLLRQVDGSPARLMLVGHNHEITALANLLGRDLAIDNLPTGGIVALAFRLAAWTELAADMGRLVLFDVPKQAG